VKRETWASVLAVVSAAFGITSIATRPFLFGPIGFLLLMVAVKLSANRRLTAPVAAIIALGGFAGAAIAVGFTKPLY
jgi:hypothetical protein